MGKESALPSTPTDGSARTYTREECVEDNRGLVIRVTDVGRKLTAEARLHYEQAVQRYVTDILTKEQMEALGTIAETVLNQLEEPHNS